MCSRADDPSQHDIESAEEWIPETIADIAATFGVTEARLRETLREAHPDASVSEILLQAREP